MTAGRKLLSLPIILALVIVSGCQSIVSPRNPEPLDKSLPSPAIVPTSYPASTPNPTPHPTPTPIPNPTLVIGPTPTVMIPNNRSLSGTSLTNAMKSEEFVGVIKSARVKIILNEYTIVLNMLVMRCGVGADAPLNLSLDEKQSAVMAGLGKRPASNAFVWATGAAVVVYDETGLQLPISSADLDADLGAALVFWKPNDSIVQGVSVSLKAPAPPFGGEAAFTKQNMAIAAIAKGVSAEATALQASLDSDYAAAKQEALAKASSGEAYVVPDASAYRVTEERLGLIMQKYIRFVVIGYIRAAS